MSGNFKVVNIKDIPQEEVLEFCKSAYHSKSDPAHVNMWRQDWQDQKETLPYHLYVGNRFNKEKGIFYALKIDDKIEVVSGAYISDFHPGIVLGGVRTWVNEEHRGKYLTGKYLLSKQYQWAKSIQAQMFCISFNEYNKNMINFVKRAGFGRVKNRTADMAFYNGVHEAPFPVNIQYTKQWVVYDLIDKNFEFDWNSIKWSEEN